MCFFLPADLKQPSVITVFHIGCDCIHNLVELHLMVPTGHKLGGANVYSRVTINLQRDWDSDHLPLLMVVLINVLCFLRDVPRR